MSDRLFKELFPNPMKQACMAAAEENLKAGNLCQAARCDGPVEYENASGKLKLCQTHWELAMSGQDIFLKSDELGT